MIKIDIIDFNEFKKLDDYTQFRKNNPDIGYLTVQAFTAYGAIPIDDTYIVIEKDIGNYRVVFFRGRTNESGIISNIELPAPKTITSQTPEIIPKYTVYDMVALHKGFETLKQYSIGMFGGTSIIQYVKMIPEGEEGELDNAD